MIDDVQIVESIGKSDHNTILCTVNLEVKARVQYIQCYGRTADYTSIITELSNTDWAQLLQIRPALLYCIT